MICRECGHGRHRLCKARNLNKQGSDCDCQHRINEPTGATVAESGIPLTELNSEAEADVQPVTE
jgi:hypothetical protein